MFSFLLSSLYVFAQVFFILYFVLHFHMKSDQLCKVSFKQRKTKVHAANTTEWCTLQAWSRNPPAASARTSVFISYIEELLKGK